MDDEIKQFSEPWHFILQSGFGHSFGLQQLHVQRGSAQTFWQFCKSLTHFMWQLGRLHWVVHFGQPCSWHTFLGQMTAHTGLSHWIEQPWVLKPLHRVWHTGAAHLGAHVASQAGFVHSHWHIGWHCLTGLVHNLRWELQYSLLGPEHLKAPFSHDDVVSTCGTSTFGTSTFGTWGSSNGGTPNLGVRIAGMSGRSGTTAGTSGRSGTTDRVNVPFPRR